MPATDKLAHARLYDLDSLTEDPRNARTHAEPQLAQLEASMRRFGWTNPLLVEAARDNLIRAGHGRVTVARRIWEAGGEIALPSGKLLPRGKVPGFDVSGWSEDDSRAYALADNQLALQAGWDDALLKEELDAIAVLGIDLGDLGFDADAMAALESRLLDEVRDGGSGKATPGKMAAEFLIPPFSILNAREGWWQDRKRQWIAIGLASEIGRGGNLIGRSLHELVAMALSSGAGVGGHYSDAKAFVDERRARGMADQDILADAQGGKPLPAVPGNGRSAASPSYSDPDHYRHQRGEKGGKVHEAIPGGAGKNAVYRDGGKAMRGKGVSGSQRLAVGDGDLVRRMTDGEGRKAFRANPGGGGTNYGKPGEVDINQYRPSRKQGLGGVTMDALSSHPRYYEQKTAAEARLGRELTNEEFEREHWVLPDSQLSSGTSIFDPVLCEIAYRWWCPPAGLVLDPFAGGSVRGIVAAALGRRYLGVDLREEQIIANRVQWDEIGPRLADLVEGQPERPAPEWLVGDSLTALDDQPLADFIFSCPPYGDFEVYSDVPGDLSTLDAAEFDRVYHEIVGKAVARLADNRFACFVVGDYREKGPGFYRNFVSKTIAAFEAGGARLYNECILITSAGSLAIRAGKQFRATRKVGKAHQNCLVFCKGDPRKATEACGPVDVTAAFAQFEADAQTDDSWPDDEFREASE